MCGIIGLWQKDGRPIPVQLLTLMRDAMHSRGPDDAGLWVDDSVGFGHRRLSIIDLSALGHQPMRDEKTGAVIIFNGEIYNFKDIRSELEKYSIKFRSQSDTEVILKAYRKWGNACVDKFKGMFAFALWDPQRRGIFVARDRMGIKPLYYYLNHNVFMFASRLKSLMLHPLCPQEIDQEALSLYLSLGFIPAPWSILNEVKKLKPGHYLWVDEKRWRETCYWSIDKIGSNRSFDTASDKELIDKLDDIMLKAVKSHMISDVPFGAFLSGGVDSSLITAMMSRQSATPINTFTIGFKEAKFDESSHARKVAQYLGTNHQVKVMESDDLLDLLEDSAANFDEPLADCSSLPTMMVSRFAKEHVTVCLTGDGGDELFAGYHIYPILSLLKPFYRLPNSWHSVVGNVMARISGQKYSIIGRSLAQPDLISGFALLRSLDGNLNHKTLLKLNDQNININRLFKERDIDFSAIDEISKVCRLDAAYYLADDVLQKVDVASMSVSLEARIPILDHDIVKFSQSLPIKFKLRGLTTKWILKRVLAKYLPENLFERPKRGFVPPIGKWLRSDLREMIQDELAPNKVEQFGYINPLGVKNKLDLHLSNKQNNQQILWALLNLFRWNEQFRAKRNTKWA